MINEDFKIGNYRIISIIGRGGMATVYLALDEKFDTHVAVKLLNKEYIYNDNIRKRFLAEARSMYRMSHPNIIKVTDLIDEGDKVAFVMEYIEGETLKQYFDRRGGLKNDEIGKIFPQMLDAVEYVHEQNLVHRDIKPSNFMRTKSGKMKLMDFGIAKNTNVYSPEYTQTGTGVQMGTPLYMSPEQITESKNVGAQSDIYSLGVILWQMVSGKKPHATVTLSDYQIKNRIVNEPLPILNSIWDSTIQKATSKEISGRYQHCSEWRSEFTSVMNDTNPVLNQLSTIKTEKGFKSEDKGDKILKPPKTWLLESVLITLILCSPLGILGIVNAIKVKSRLKSGDIDGARKASESARNWTLSGLLLGILFLFIIFILGANEQDDISPVVEDYDYSDHDEGLVSDLVKGTNQDVYQYDTSAIDVKPVALLSAEEKMLVGTRTFGSHWIEPYGTATISKNDGIIRIVGNQKSGDDFCKIEGIITIIDDRNFEFDGTISLRHHTTEYLPQSGEFIPAVDDKTLEGKQLFRRVGARQFWRLKQPDSNTGTGYFKYSYHYIDIFI